MPAEIRAAVTEITLSVGKFDTGSLQMPTPFFLGE
jgi:hypothetical protein